LCPVPPRPHLAAAHQFNEKCKKEDKLIAAVNFCKLLRYFRRLLLQDAPHLAGVEIFDHI
jgi:hypothetical protein